MCYEQLACAFVLFVLEHRIVATGVEEAMNRGACVAPLATCSRS